MVDFVGCHKLLDWMRKPSNVDKKNWSEILPIVQPIRFVLKAVGVKQSKKRLRGKVGSAKLG